MAKRPTPDITALTVRERMLLFCIGSETDWQRAGVTGETVTNMIVKGLIVRDALGHPPSRMMGAPRCGRCCPTYDAQQGTMPGT